MGNRWNERATECLSQLESLRESTRELAEDCDADQMRELRRLGRVLGVTEARLSGRSPELISQSALSQLAGAIQATRQAVDSARAAAGAEQVPNLHPVNDTADQILDALRSTPVPQTTPRSVETALSQLEEDAFLAQTRIQSKAEELEAGMTLKSTETSQQIEASRLASETTATEFREVVSNHRQQIDALQARVDTLIDNQQANFSNTLETQRGEFGSMLEEIRTRLDEWMKEQNGKIATTFSATEDDAKSRLAEIAVLLEDAEKIVGVIGVTGLTGGYQQHAEKEGRTSRWWRLATVASGLGAVAFLAWAAFHAGTGNSSLVSFAAKAGVSVAFGTLAYYTGRIASRHHARAAHYRSRELALASLGPYLERLPDSQQHELLATMAPTFFSELNEDGVSSDWQPQAGVSAEQLAQMLAKIVK